MRAIRLNLDRLRRRRAAAGSATGFTMIELLVVIAILLVLTGLIVPSLSAARKRRLIVFASEEVRIIKAAAQAYHEALNCYPPDTDSFVTGLNPETAAPDPDSIYKYLGRKLTDPTTKVEYGPFMACKTNFLKGTQLMTYMDPWGNPYHMDCAHPEMDPSTGVVTIRGDPNPAGSGALKDDPNAYRRLEEVKVWSNGPDGKENQGSNEWTGKNVETDPVNADNITSWDN